MDHTIHMDHMSMDCNVAIGYILLWTNEGNPSCFDAIPIGLGSPKT